MSYITNDKECKQCGFGSAWFSIDEDTGEWWLRCPMCGYAVLPIGDSQRKEAHVSTSGFEEDEGLLLYGHERKGYGAFGGMDWSGRRGELGSMLRPLSNDQVEKLWRGITSNPAFNPNTCFVSVWDDASETAKVLFGKVPIEPVQPSAEPTISLDSELVLLGETASKLLN